MPHGEKGERSALGWLIPGLLLLAVLVTSGSIMLVNDRYPSFSTEQSAEVDSQQASATNGTAYVDALIYVHDAGLRPWLPNDRIFPTALLDNKPNHQLGQLEGLRTAIFVLRENLSRLGVEDPLDPDVDEAFNRFAIAADAWFLPSAEGEYAAGAAALRRYRDRLAEGKARFYARPDNFLELLNRFHSLLGAANMALYSSIGEFQQWIEQKELEGRLNADESIAKVRVGRFEVDDQFYYAKGVAFVYREILNACLADFQNVLGIGGGRKLAHSIVHDYLAFSQFDPLLVLNGSLGSLTANHPYQMLGLLSQVRERSYSLGKVISPLGR